ncbi:TadE family type IV pilus minor pilin [Actinacidiphila acidipaludis]|uniref:Pilus assembly protein n=1 Tax=Actinacidiphila acidipaludis TaxID=2873382 RepID=A0ABS7QE09_9ACTN|nr:TadE family type IV pilus minor pilin [Streptomyces acidipaludis]MBY8881398.1 pilus assembly protein [Streptomyces acidipaludis]
MRRSDRAGRPRRGDRGYVTAETAMVIPMLVALTGLLVWGVMAAAAQVRCVDAARAGAREAARSEAPADVLKAARAAAPAGAQVSVRRDGDTFRVRVTVPAPRFPITLTAEAAALDEDAVGGGGGP